MTTVPTPIVDKNGKATTVHKKADKPGGGVDRLRSVPLASADRPAENEYDSIKSEIDALNAESHSWKGKRGVNERATLALAKSLVFRIDNDIQPGEPLDPIGEPLDKIRGRLSGLHFAKESLSDRELDILSLGEKLLKKIDSEDQNAFAH